MCINPEQDEMLPLLMPLLLPVLLLPFLCYLRI